MKSIFQNKLKLVSGIFHGILATIVATTLVLMFELEFDLPILILWFASIGFGIFYGLVFSNWYIPIEGERFYFEPYVVTPLVSLFSSISGSLLSGFAIEFFSGPLETFSFSMASGYGFIAGIWGFILSLPVTLPVGLITGVLFQRYSTN